MLPALPGFHPASARSYLLACRPPGGMPSGRAPSAALGTCAGTWPPTPRCVPANSRRSPRLCPRAIAWPLSCRTTRCGAACLARPTHALLLPGPAPGAKLGLNAGNPSLSATAAEIAVRAATQTQEVVQPLVRHEQQRWPRSIPVCCGVRQIPSTAASRPYTRRWPIRSSRC